MPDVKVSRFADLASSDECCLGLSPERGLKLAAVEYRAKIVPAPTEYRTMIDACCEAAKPLTDALFSENFKARLILVGAKRSLDMRQRLPNYSLAMPLERHQLLGAEAMENIFPLQELERTAGIYMIPEGKFCDACWFMTQNSWSIAIISRREEFWCAETLAQVYRAAAFDDSAEPVIQLNWPALSAAFCPMGDVVVKTIGAFDDKERAVNFIYDPRNPITRALILENHGDIH
jgi:hypothetical protein